MGPEFLDDGSERTHFGKIFSKLKRASKVAEKLHAATFAVRSRMPARPLTTPGCTDISAGLYKLQEQHPETLEEND